MKILFINPNLTRQEHISLGIAYLSSFLKREGHQTYLLDYTFGGNVIDSLEKIKQVKPDIIGFSLRSGEFKFCLKLAEEVKKQFKTPIIFGGVHPTVAPEETISKKSVDIICIGEGELALAELLEKMEKSQEYTKTRNFWFKKNGQIIKNPLRPLIQNLDQLPSPDRKLFNFSKYLEYRNGEFDILMGRGCPFNCTYCTNHILQEFYKKKGRYIRTRSVNNVLREIKILKENYDIRLLAFRDDIFGIDKKWVKEFSEKYSKEVRLPFHCNVRPELVTQDFCLDLKRAGCATLNIGIETGSEKLRKNILRRLHSNETIIKAFDIAKKAGLVTYSYNMVGLPYETDSDVQETIDLNQQVGPDFLQISIFQPYPGTTLRDICKKEGWLTEKDIPVTFKTESILNYPDRSARKIKWQKTFFRYNVLKKINPKKALLTLVVDINLDLFYMLRDKIPLPIKKLLVDVENSLHSRKKSVAGVNLG